MAGRKLLRDFLLSKRPLHLHLFASPQVSISTTRLGLISPNSYTRIRQLSFFKDVSKKVKEEAKRDPEFEQSVKELKKKAEELKVVKEDLKNRTKQTTEQLYKHVDGVWTEAEATAKKVSSNLKEKVSAATEEVKETLGIGKQDSSGTSAKFDSGESDGSKSASGEDKQHRSGSSDATETLFSKVKSRLSKISPTISSAFQRIKDTKPVDFAKKGYGIVKDELSGTPTNKKRLEYAEPSTNSSANVERSTISDLVVAPSKQSRWSKTWEAFKEKLQGHPVYKRVGGISKPVVVKSQELVEDVREMWEVSDNPVVHKIQDLNETVFGETAAGISMKEIRRRDPSFSLPEFLEEIHEVIRPILTAYDKVSLKLSHEAVGDTKFLEKYCCSEIIERCKAEHRAYESQNIVIHNKILHISDVEVRETKMMGDTPIIIVVFRTQQVYCIKDKLGSVTEGSKDTILTVYYGWAMQRIHEEELEECAPFPIWKLREMQKSGVQALI